MTVAASSVRAALRPIVLAAVRAQIRRRGPCLRWKAGSPSRGNNCKRESQNKRKVRGRADLLKHLPECESVFPGELLLGPSQVAASHRQRSAKAGDSEFTEQLWKEQQTGREVQDPLEIPAADLVETGVVCRAGQIEVFSSV